MKDGRSLNFVVGLFFVFLALLGTKGSFAGSESKWKKSILWIDPAIEKNFKSVEASLQFSKTQGMVLDVRVAKDYNPGQAAAKQNPNYTKYNGYGTLIAVGIFPRETSDMNENEYNAILFRYLFEAKQLYLLWAHQKQISFLDPGKLLLYQDPKGRAAEALMQTAVSFYGLLGEKWKNEAEKNFQYVKKLSWWKNPLYGELREDLEELQSTMETFYSKNDDRDGSDEEEEINRNPEPRPTTKPRTSQNRTQNQGTRLSQKTPKALQENRTETPTVKRAKKGFGEEYASSSRAVDQEEDGEASQENKRKQTETNKVKNFGGFEEAFRSKIPEPPGFEEKWKEVGERNRSRGNGGENLNLDGISPTPRRRTEERKVSQGDQTSPAAPPSPNQNASSKTQRNYWWNLVYAIFDIQPE